MPACACAYTSICYSFKPLNWHNERMNIFHISIKPLELTQTLTQKYLHMCLMYVSSGNISAGKISLLRKHTGIRREKVIFTASLSFIWLDGRLLWTFDTSFSDWEENNEFYCNKWWPGWDKNLTAEMKQKLNIKGIREYLSRTQCS